KIDEKPRTVSPRIRRSTHCVGENSFVESGTQIVHPVAGGPAMNAEYRTMPPASSSQYESALRRGNAMSRAPSCSGMTKFGEPVQTGTTNRKTIVVPCIVKNELYCCAVRNPVSGVASC